MADLIKLLVLLLFVSCTPTGQLLEPEYEVHDDGANIFFESKNDFALVTIRYTHITSFYNACGVLSKSRYVSNYDFSNTSANVLYYTNANNNTMCELLFHSIYFTE